MNVFISTKIHYNKQVANKLYSFIVSSNRKIVQPGYFIMCIIVKLPFRTRSVPWIRSTHFRVMHVKAASTILDMESEHGTFHRIATTNSLDEQGRDVTPTQT